ncbi:hypothetical protein K0M31_003712, partial [Melipona bicolor]
MSSWIERRRQLCHSGNAGMPAVAPGPCIGTRRTANQFARLPRPLLVTSFPRKIEIDDYGDGSRACHPINEPIIGG